MKPGLSRRIGAAPIAPPVTSANYSNGNNYSIFMYASGVCGLRRCHMRAQSPPARAGIGSCVSRLLFFFCFRAVPPRAFLYLSGSAPRLRPLPPVLRLFNVPPPQPLVTYQGIFTAACPPFPGARVAHGIPTVNPKMYSLLFSIHNLFQISARG